MTYTYWFRDAAGDVSSFTTLMAAVLAARSEADNESIDVEVRGKQGFRRTVSPGEFGPV
ncbi:MAG: hypothetical protein ACO24H_10025 [Polynucleobacter sp.]